MFVQTGLNILYRESGSNWDVFDFCAYLYIEERTVPDFLLNVRT